MSVHYDHDVYSKDGKIIVSPHGPAGHPGLHAEYQSYDVAMRAVTLVSQLSEFRVKIAQPELLKAFCAEMEGRQYGREEIRNAFSWFASGWEAAKVSP